MLIAVKGQKRGPKKGLDARLPERMMALDTRDGLGVGGWSRGDWFELYC